MTEKTMEEIIEESAANPKTMETDGMKVEEHSLGDLIKADKYLEQKKAAKNGGPLFRVGRFNPPGADGR